MALDIPKWKGVVMEEMRALETNETWELATFPEEHRPMGCKWVFSVEYKSDKTLEVQSKIGGKRLHSDIWNRLLRNSLMLRSLIP